MTETIERVQRGTSPLSRRAREFRRPGAWSQPNKKARARLNARLADWDKTQASVRADMRTAYRKPGSMTK